VTHAAGFLRRNGLSVAVTLLFALFMVGQTVTGQHVYNEERMEHGQASVPLSSYLATGHFLEATMENWESEFLQMGAYVLLTASLYQRGSSESKKLGEKEAVDRDPRLAKNKAKSPWPVRRGGWVLKLYEYSLTIAFMALFLLSLSLHALGGVNAFNEERLTQGEPPVSLVEFVSSAQFWFESLQNWQSEFLALAAMVVLSIWLRQRGSPESKPVDAPHAATGQDS
jgi:hypothetical protein